MNYEQEILTRLLEKYEKSKAYTTGVFTRRIALSVPKADWLGHRLEQPEEKRLFLAALRQLQKQGLIQYSWVKFEEGNLVDQIWLIPKQDALKGCYRLLGRVPTSEKAAGLNQLIEVYKGQLEPSSSLYHFLTQYQQLLCQKQQIRSFFTDDPVLNENLLKCLVFMEHNQGEQMERLMSSALYGDSKYFEHSLKSRVLSILRQLKKEEQEEIPEDEELLGEKGIVRWPEILEFTGPLSLTLTDGRSIDYSSQPFGAYINSETVKRVHSVQAEAIRQVLFIENKANYIWYISKKRQEDELVLFHGGCYSPVKGRWFRKVWEGCQSCQRAKPVSFLHWSDIDIGGFRIFHRLQKEIVPELEPLCMDRAALERFRNQTMKIKSGTYLNTLKKMAEDPGYERFHPVIQMMIQEGIRLEQEEMILQV